MTRSLLFPGSFGLSYRDFEIEIIAEGCRRSPHLLESIQEEVLTVATYSRGWDEQSLDLMRAHFKLGPLYQANSLVLIRKVGRLVGLAGSVNDWKVESGSLVHLCSLGLLPEAQKRGFLPVLLGILWSLTLRLPQVRQDFRSSRVYITAITQSPYLLAMLHELFDLYPSPEHPSIPAEIKSIAHAVVERFDAELHLDDERLIIRNECKFFYQRTPYSSNRRLNSFCDHHLNYREGDVFVLVGKVIPEKIEKYLESIAAAHSDLYIQFCEALKSNGWKEHSQDGEIAGILVDT